MQTIYKYAVSIGPDQVLWIPHDAELIHFGDQAGVLNIWVRMDDSEPKLDRKIHVVGTGYPLPERLIKHVGSVQGQDGLVWHAFEEVRF